MPRADSSRGWLSRLSALALALALPACFGGGTVTRFAGGELRTGPVVPPRAYEAFLRGALAEERGDLGAAARGYRAALEEGPDDPEVWSRLGRVWCLYRRQDANHAFAKALALDPEFEGALVRRAECTRARGETHESGGRASADLALAMQVSPRRVEIAARAVSWGEGVDADRAYALTIAHGDSPAAWGALADYARARSDARVEVRALRVLVRLDAAGRTRGALRAVSLLDAGEIALARSLAGSAVDAARKVGPDPAARAAGLDAAKLQVVSMLALDDALAEGDVRTARRRAAVTHLGLEEAAARALAFGERALARELAAELFAADPSSTAAALVIVLVDEDAARTARTLVEAPSRWRQLQHMPGGMPKLGRPLPSALAVELSERLLRVAGPEAASSFFAEVQRAPVIGADTMLVPRLVELAARGVARPGDLPPEGRVELAARLGASAAPASPDGSPGSPAASEKLDAPHAYLRATLAAPGAEATRALGARAAQSHPVVVVADVRAALVAGRVSDAALWARVAGAEHDPLVLAARLELARARGDEAGVARARELLAARAGTEHERRLVGAR